MGFEQHGDEAETDTPEETNSDAIEKDQATGRARRCMACTKQRVHGLLVCIRHLVGLVPHPFKWVNGVCKETEKQALRLVWNGPGQPADVVDYCPQILLRGTHNGRYLASAKDGTLTTVRTVLGRDTSFEVLELSEDWCTLEGAHGVHEVEIVQWSSPATEPCLIVQVQGEAYKQMELHHHSFLSSITTGGMLRALVKRQYKLKPVEQRDYVARSFGIFMEYLLVDTDCNCFPSNVPDIICALTIAIRRVEAVDNVDSDLTKSTVRKQILSELGTLVKFTRIREAVHEQSKTACLHDRDLSLTAEEIVGVCVKLQQLENMVFKRFIVSCSRLLRVDNNEQHPRMSLMNSSTPVIPEPDTQGLFPGCSCGGSLGFDVDQLEITYGDSGRREAWI